jgi:hypothetical protein
MGALPEVPHRPCSRDLFVEYGTWSIALMNVRRVKNAMVTKEYGKDLTADAIEHISLSLRHLLADVFALYLSR